MEEARNMYIQYITGWNKRNAAEIAALCSPDTSLVGFDGSMMHGVTQIRQVLQEIFSHHQTAQYVYIIKHERMLADNIYFLQSVAGMVPRGETDINPSVNAVQTMIASKKNGEWKIDIFQNTPAAFHGRPEIVAQLSNDLQSVVAQQLSL